LNQQSHSEITVTHRPTTGGPAGRFIIWPSMNINTHASNMS